MRPRWPQLIYDWPTPFHDTEQRVASLLAFVHFYNQQRPHWSLNGQPPPWRPTQ